MMFRAHFRSIVHVRSTDLPVPKNPVCLALVQYNPAPPTKTLPGASTVPWYPKSLIKLSMALDKKHA